MDIIPVRNMFTHIAPNQPFSITITEPDCSNCKWQVDIPPTINLLNMNRIMVNYATATQWIFSSAVAGTYVLTFYYRKQCCGKPIIKQVSYNLSIY